MLRPHWTCYVQRPFSGVPRRSALTFRLPGNATVLQAFRVTRNCGRNGSAATRNVGKERTVHVHTTVHTTVHVQPVTLRVFSGPFCAALPVLHAHDRWWRMPVVESQGSHVQDFESGCYGCIVTVHGCSAAHGPLRRPSTSQRTDIAQARVCSTPMHSPAKSGAEYAQCCQLQPPTVNGMSGSNRHSRRQRCLHQPNAQRHRKDVR